MSPARPGSPSPPRAVAYEVLRRTFEQGAWTDRAFPSVVARAGLDDRERAQARRLAYGSVQRRGPADALVAALSGRRAEALDPAVAAALRLGLYELLFADAVADHAAVDEAVELAKLGLGRDRAPRGRVKAAAGFANAILRRAASEREQLLAELDDSTPERAATGLSYPQWLTEMLFAELGPDEARSVLAAMNEPAETALRVNRLRADPERVAAELRAAGVGVRGPGSGGLLDPADGIVVDRSTEAVRERLETGELIGQSRGSQAVIAVLDPRPGERVLDLCAAPGTKTTAIAARVGTSGRVVSVELDSRRAEELRALCERAGATNVTVELGDAAEADLGAGYDRVLVDPPCSDLGTFASRPDARWRKSPEQIDRLAALQRRILARGARALRPGGALVYSTCTLSARENERVAAATEGYAAGIALDRLGDEHPGHRLRADRRFLSVRPDRDRTTGFFIARMRRPG